MYVFMYVCMYVCVYVHILACVCASSVPASVVCLHAYISKDILFSLSLSPPYTYMLITVIIRIVIIIVYTYIYIYILRYAGSYQFRAGYKERAVCVCVRPSVIRVHVELITDMTCLPTLGMNPFPLKF